VLWVLRLGAFTSVTLATVPVDDGIALIVNVTEATPYIPSLSIRLTQENGFEIGPAVSSSNLLGTSARASAYARFGGATNFGVRYADPLLPGRSFVHGYKFEYFHRERTNELIMFQENTDEIFLEFLQATQEQGRVGFRFRYIGLQSDQDGVTLGTDNYDHVPSLGLFYQSDSRNGIYPTNGYYLDLEAGKWGVFGGDSDFWRLDLDLRSYTRLPLLGDRHSMTFSTFASLTAGELGETIPNWHEFYVGGTNSVRGWSLGSRHGQHQWLNTIEYWFRLMDQKRWKFWFIKWRMGMQIGAFYDFGTAWSDYQDLEQNMIGGGGVGLRLTLPVITMFRMDFAYGEDGMGVRFFIGGAEKAIAQKDRVR
jgi:outer membrane protein assembly factor BamA